MSPTASHKVAIIGCGNVAWHLAKRFGELGNFSVSVYNHRDNPLLRRFSEQLGCKVYSNLANITTSARYYFVCVADRYVAKVSRRIPCQRNALVLHTSGSLGLEELQCLTGRKAVIYPLQSFSLADAVTWEGLPLLVEADELAAQKQALQLARRLSSSVTMATAERRLLLHLSAVFVNNFTNALCVSAGDLLRQHGYPDDFGLLQPLLQKTIDKVQLLGPRAAQTGPARRGDRAVQKRHLKLMKNNKDLKQLYKALSDLIVKQQATYA